MSIYEKLQTVRVELQNENISKSGKNTFSNYDYYELKDFLPAVNRLCLKYKIAPIIDFGNEHYVTLTIHDFENSEEKIVFSSPKADAVVKGAQAIQNLGAAETYQRRYLYLMAFEIAECDIVDKQNNLDSKKNETSRKHSATAAQINRIWAEAKQLGLTGEDVKKIMDYRFSVTDKALLTFDQAKQLIGKIDTIWNEICSGKNVPEDDRVLEEAIQK